VFVIDSAHCGNILFQIHNDAYHISDDVLKNLEGQVNKWQTAYFMKF
jgi:hypothetical protein